MIDSIYKLMRFQKKNIYPRRPKNEYMYVLRYIYQGAEALQNCFFRDTIHPCCRSYHMHSGVVTNEKVVQRWNLCLLREHRKEILMKRGTTFSGFTIQLSPRQLGRSKINRHLFQLFFFCRSIYSSLLQVSFYELYVPHACTSLCMSSKRCLCCV